KILLAIVIKPILSSLPEITIYELTSPAFNTKLSYCPHINCTRRIRCSKDAHIVFTINSLDIKNDRLNFYVESWGNESFMSYTESEGSLDEVDSGESTLSVQFVTD
ncbi:hypothetical protein PFISCL1PPCAC_23979, partial [Pristionchus fissidentatus]